VRVADPEHHIAEQRVAAHRPAQPDAEPAVATQKVDAPSTTEAQASGEKPGTAETQAARLAAYADEAAELLAGSYPAKKKRRTPSEVAADEASSRVARSSQKDSAATDDE
jgi:hypothetical protein